MHYYLFLGSRTLCKCELSLLWVLHMINPGRFLGMSSLADGNHKCVGETNSEAYREGVQTPSPSPPKHQHHSASKILLQAGVG